MARDIIALRRDSASFVDQKEGHSMTDAIKKCLNEIKDAASSGRLDTVMLSDASIQKSWGPAMRRCLFGLSAAPRLRQTIPTAVA